MTNQEEKMFCPMTFNNSNERGAWKECDPRCAWSFHCNGKVSCAVAIGYAGMQGANAKVFADD